MSTEQQPDLSLIARQQRQILDDIRDLRADLKASSEDAKKDKWDRAMEQWFEASKSMYREMVDQGMDPEEARRIVNDYSKDYGLCMLGFIAMMPVIALITFFFDLTPGLWWQIPSSIAGGVMVAGVLTCWLPKYLLPVGCLCAVLGILPFINAWTGG